MGDILEKCPLPRHRIHMQIAASTEINCCFFFNTEVNIFSCESPSQPLSKLENPTWVDINKVIREVITIYL